MMLWQSYPVVLVLLLTVAVFVGFVRGRPGPDVVALLAVVFLLLFGLLETRDALSVLANDGPVTVGCMFVLSAALERTGVIGRVGAWVSDAARRSRTLAIAGLIGGVIVVSAFVNNTPVVVVLTPVVIGLAQTLGMASSRLLIPLSFAAIFGGVCTLIGTSTNLLANGLAQSNGLSGFGMFEITPVGLVMAVVGSIYLALAGRWLLPDRPTLASLFTDRSKRYFISEVLVTSGSPIIGRTLAAAGLLKNPDTLVVDVIRGDQSLRQDMGTLSLEAGDRLILQTHANEVLSIKGDRRLAFSGQDLQLEPISARDLVIMEGIVGPQSRFVGRRVASLNLRRRYGVYVIAVHRDNEDMPAGFDDLMLRFGDTLLIEGPADGIKRLLDEQMLINLAEVEHRPVRREKAPLAVAAIVAVMLLATLGVMPIAGLALVAVAVVIVGGCLRADEAYASIEWRLLALIYGMLALSLALDHSGAVRLIVTSLVQSLGDLGPWAMLALVYFICSLLTEMVSNNAVAVLMTPIAIGVAHQIGVDPRGFVVAVMFGASASFATPIGYQTNTFVFNAGNYRFTDFTRIGLPLNIILWGVGVLTIPLFFPF